MQTPLFTGGKLQGWTLMAARVSGRSSSRLFFVIDSDTGTRFLVDTGAEVSVIPPSPNECVAEQTGLVLRAANDSTIKTFGTRSQTLHLGPQQTFQWVFVMADVKQPILGADFLRHYQLLVDVAQRRVVHTPTQSLVQGVLSSSSSMQLALLSSVPANRYEALLHEFPW